MKKLSIITVNRNHADGLRRTLASVWRQTFADFEQIVIDGASTDHSGAVIRPYADRLAFWVSEPDGGIYDAMNKGIARAAGEYCLFLNSGDYLSHDAVLAEFFGHSFTEDIVYGDIFLQDANGKTRLQKSVPDDQLFVSDLVGSGVSIPHPATVIKRALFATAGNYRADFRVAADTCFFIKALFKHDASFKHLAVPLSVFSAGGISSAPQSRPVIEKEISTALREMFPFSYPGLLFHAAHPLHGRAGKMLQRYFALRKKFSPANL